MWHYAVRRLIMTLPILVGVTVICFALIQIAPGDPIQLLLRPDTSPEDIARLRAYYGLDRPVAVQYLLWVWHALGGNLGIAISTNQPVAEEVARAFSNTIVIALIAAFLAYTIALVLGFAAASRPGGPVDRAVSLVSVMAVSLPTYWVAIVLVIVFAVTLNWLPAMGMGASGSANFNYFRWSDFRYALLPIIAMALPSIAIMTRTTQASLSEIMNRDFIEALRSKGLHEHQVVLHALRNVLPSSLAMIGLELGYLLGGSILVETVFNWPGTGSLLGKAIQMRDIPLLQGTILMLASVFVLLNIIVDLLQSMIDPRIRRN